jgi:uncharacterized protein (TIGR03437 family)
MVSRRFCAVAVIGCALACFAASAQTSINSVRIYTDPPGPYFTVDGQNASGAVDLLWPVGSKHFISSNDQNKGPGTTQYIYKGWSTNLSGTTYTDQPLTAGPGLTSIKLQFTVSVPLDVALPNCPDVTQPCSTAGYVEIGGTRLDRRTILYYSPGSTVQLRAFPNSGFVFTGWSSSGIIAPPNVFDISIVVNGESKIAPIFNLASAVNANVNIVTDPPSLQILLDRTPYVPPVSLQWGWGSVHSVGIANPVQLYRGTPYVFDSWSDGGAINHDITVPNGSSSVNLTARFVPASSVVFGTSPSGLKLSIDGLDWPSYDFNWVPGSVHRISAPDTQADSAGHKYRFVSWSNGKPATFDYTVPPAPGLERITATYQQLGRATITSTPTGQAVEVDGVACATPCAIEKEVGATVSLSVPQVRDLSEGSRLVFQGWNDSGDARRTITLGADLRVYTAAFAEQNRLAVTATPPEGAAFTLTPSSPDGYYDSSAVVSVSVKLALGFKISSWSGDASGSASTVAVSLDGPRSLVIALNRVPTIGPLGVRNAALPANPDSSADVAPGSLISIYGANLAGDLATGATNPLPQTLGNVTVRVDDSFLPLVFVSPSQINAQLPATTSEGTHKVIVRWEGKPETSVSFSVTRNAPGLFSSGTQDQPIGAFLQASGRTVTADQPAHSGDVVSVLGTGLGPYAMTPPDSFVFDENAGFTLVDPVTVVVGADQTVDTIYAGRSAAGAGVDAVQFQLPANLPDTPFVPVKIRINGRESNTVLLPVAH